MNWILLIILVLAALFIAKLWHFKTKVLLIIIVLIGLIFYFTFTHVVDNNQIDLDNMSGVIQGFQVYSSWIGQAFTNLRTLTMNAIGLDWIPEGHNVSELDPRNVMKG